MFLLCPILCNPMDCSTPGFSVLSPKVYSNSCPLSQQCRSTISSCGPLLILPSIFPHVKIFPNELILHISSVQFSRSVVSDSLQPHELQHTRPPCPSPTAGVHPNPCPLSQQCHPTISPSVVPFSSCPQSFPASGSFQISQLFTSGSQSFSFSISPSSEHPGLISFRMDWLDLLAVQGTLKSLLQNHSSKASILQHSAFFFIQLSHPYMTTGKTVGQNIGISASASVLPRNIQGWFPLGLTGLISFLSRGLWRVFCWTSLKTSILWHSAFFMIQFSHPYMTTGKTIALTRWTFVGKVMSLLFNTLLMLVIAFLPRSSSVQLFSCVWLFATHGLQHTRLPCPSPTPESCSNSCPLSWWCHPTISSSVISFSCLQSFPASGSFTISQFFISGGQSIGVSASASVLPMNIQDWFPLWLTGWISLQSKGLSRVFSNTTV